MTGFGHNLLGFGGGALPPPYTGKLLLVAGGGGGGTTSGGGGGGGEVLLSTSFSFQPGQSSVSYTHLTLPTICSV